MRRRGFSLIVTKRGLGLVAALLLLFGALLGGPKLVIWGQRQFCGVKKGVFLEGHLVEGLLKEELYDVVAGLGETFYKEAENASWNWELGVVTPEVVGRIIDIPATVETLLQAPAHSQLSLVTLAVLPSVTAAYFRPYYRGPALEPRVALLVNVDWGNEFIRGMLEVFAEYNVGATWFLTGRWAALTPQLAKEIALAGHEIGNHGGWHGLTSAMSRQEVIELIREGEEKITSATGQKPQLFAPPAGDFNQQTVAAAAELRYKTVLWTVDTVDWRRPAPTVIVDRVLSKIGNGALVLMHPTKPTLEALPVILDHLQSLGFQCVTVSELLAD